MRFRNQGLDSVEVQDNGSGISLQNYETLALKHHTSKLSTYSDLNTLQTFGFRGEALSSLCALSHFTVTTCLAKDAPKGTKLDFETSGKLKGTSVVAAQKGTTVTVENLFQNLPVRRRELERNIKREWNRVVGLLGQYACIKTGVKISVTQQSSKGKKTILFSTKGNPSTRENIVNVFGAKTFTALLNLDLKLELEPSSGPGQRWSTQDDDRTKEIHVTGHVSRPAFGEGRQTPDRQMFFVNARPCSLPQVAKAFNEVYKSYNSSQSPFIFANIEMDTHLYDVNVSPDKRTILLHDQTRMLEQLKLCLTELFESQDHTVPISQLLAQKQPLYKQLTISRSDATPRATSRKLAASTETEEASNDESQPASREGDLNEPERQAKRKARADQASVSRNSMNRDREAMSLINDWFGKKTEDRSAQQNANPNTDVGKYDDLSINKRKLVENFVKENNQANAALKPVSGLEVANDELLSPENVSNGTSDYNQHGTDSQATRKTAVCSREAIEPGESIPAIATPIRRAYPAVAGASQSIARPNRSPATMATITIGDRTVVSPIGSPSKRSRIHEAAQSPPSQPSLPSFGTRLSQRFAASHSGISITTDVGDAIMTGDVEEDESSPLPERDESPSAVRQPEEAPSEKAPAGQTSKAKPAMKSSSHLSPEDIDTDFVDEDEKKAREEAKVSEMIRAAEEDAARLSEDNAKRTQLLLKGSTKRKDTNVHLVKTIATTWERIESQSRNLTEALRAYNFIQSGQDIGGEALDSQGAEERLSLTINKSDFSKMKVIGQFNLGFIIASRCVASAGTKPNEHSATNDLFIIDQHASDEKYNFERLQATTIVQTQRLVRPKTLDLTAVEEEIVIENRAALETNGFVVTVDESGNSPVGQRCQLVSLPLSRETTFSLSDLEELLALLAECPSGSVPRPSKVRKMFAMRACRSSIMIGRTLTHKQMGQVVKHMGEIDKPWNCPHGRPTMRHLYDLAVWDEVGWREGDSVDGEKGGATDWAAYIRQKKELQD